MKLYYVYDPLCVFCYGFGEIIHKFYNKYKDQYVFEFLPGGLWVHDGVLKVTDQVGDKLKHATERVHSMSGRPFDDSFFELMAHNPVFDSMMGTQAMVYAQEEMDDPLRFLDEIHKSIFQMGKDPSSESTYTEVGSRLGLDVAHVFDTKHMKMADSMILRAKELGVESYPTLLMVSGDHVYSYPIDYGNYDHLEKWFTDCLEDL